MSTIEAATSELHRIFAAFNTKYFNDSLPTPAITIQTSGKRKSMGWCSREAYWKGADIERHEINISAEFLAIEIYETADTMLHEMVHLHNATVLKVQDCSRQGNYHNAKFKQTTERDNMFVRNYDKPDKKLGWSICNISDATKAFVDTIGIDANAFLIHRDVPEKLKKPSNSVKLVCPSCEISVRASKKGLLIMCKACNEEMVDPDEPFDEDYEPDEDEG